MSVELFDLCKDMLSLKCVDMHSPNYFINALFITAPEKLIPELQNVLFVGQ